MVERLGWRGHQVPLVQKAKNLQALGTCRFDSERLLGSAPSGGMYRFLLHDFYFTKTAPALATASSCEPVPPEQPMEPISLPDSTKGMPPRDAMTSSKVPT